MTDRYVFWRDSLAGKKPPIINETPNCGFYRMKRGDRWVPVAVWPLGGTALVDTGFGFKFGSEVVGEHMGTEQWPWYAAHPITEEVYRAVCERGENWPDADPIVAAMTNGATKSAQPATQTVPDATKPAADPVDEMREQITVALKGVAAYAKIGDEDANARAAGLRNMLMKLSGDADKDGKALYEPHFRKYKALYDQWNPLVKLAKDGADKIKKALEAYADDKRKAAAAAAARAEEERKRLEKERFDAAVQAQIDGEPSPDFEEIAPVVVQSNMPLPTTQVRPTFGRAAHVGTKNVVTDIDVDKVFAALRHMPEMREFLMGLAQKAVSAGITVNGATIEERSAIK
jgi:hypothetical protein